MGALSKVFSPFYRATSMFFSTLFPETLRLIVLTLWVLWASYRRERSRNEYMQMINKKTSKFVYRRKKRSEDELHECSICLSEFSEGDEARELQCKHIFHKNCLEEWLQSSRATCPLCRSLVLPEEIVLEHKRLQSDRQLLNSCVEEELALILLSTTQNYSCHGFF